MCQRCLRCTFIHCAFIDIERTHSQLDYTNGTGEKERASGGSRIVSGQGRYTGRNFSGWGRSFIYRDNLLGESENFLFRVGAAAPTALWWIRHCIRSNRNKSSNQYQMANTLMHQVALNVLTLFSMFSLTPIVAGLETDPLVELDCPASSSFPRKSTFNENQWQL